MKITHIIGGAERGGSRSHLLTLCKELQERFVGIEVEIVCLINGAVAEGARELGIPLTIFPMRNPGDLRVIAPLRRHFKSTSPTIIHTHGVRANFIGRLAARGLGIPLITTVHSSVYSDYSTHFKRLFFPVIEKMTRRYTDRFIVVCSSLRRELEEDGIPSDRIALIYNGLPNSRSPDRGPAASLRKELGIEPGMPILMSVGRMEAMKDPKTLLQVFSALESRTRFHGVIVGDGSLSHRLHRSAERLGLGPNVSFLGFRRDVPSLLKQADVFISTSKTEGLSMALLEAMQARKPVVVSDVGGNSEVVRLARNGFVTPQNDVKQYVRRILQLLGDAPLRETLAGCGVQALTRHFSVESFVGGIREVYEEETQKVRHVQR